METLLREVVTVSLPRPRVVSLLAIALQSDRVAWASGVAPGARSQLSGARLRTPQNPSEDLEIVARRLAGPPLQGVVVPPRGEAELEEMHVNGLDPRPASCVVGL